MSTKRTSPAADASAAARRQIDTDLLADLVEELARMDADLERWAKKRRGDGFSWSVGSPEYRADFGVVAEGLRTALGTASSDAPRLEAVRRLVAGQRQDPEEGWLGADEPPDSDHGPDPDGEDSDDEGWEYWDEEGVPLAPAGIADAVHRIEAVLEVPVYDAARAVSALDRLCDRMEGFGREHCSTPGLPPGPERGVEIHPDEYTDLTEQIRAALAARTDDRTRLRRVLTIVAALRRSVAEDEYQATVFVEGWGDELSWARQWARWDVLEGLERVLKPTRLPRRMRPSG